ncbi:MAG: MFS transporter [Dysgonamonadaceae bacterium]|jgi:MFS family permease|nr:MFS transporter [Dysgonamonadaceae bacterium]
MTEKIVRSLHESKAARWIALILVAFTMMAGYFFTDVISPIEGVLSKTLHWDGAQFGAVTGNYSFFNIVGFLLIGGIILDKLGIRYTGTLFTAIMIIGASLKLYAVSDYFNQGGFGYDFFNSFWTDILPSAKLATIGFAIFGLGCEMAGVTVTRIIVKWFEGKEMALAMGLQVALARLGTGGAFLLSPRLAGDSFAFKAVLLGAVFVCVGFRCFLVYTILDVKVVKELNTRATTSSQEEEPFRISDVGRLLTNNGFLYISLLCVLFYSCVFPFIKFAASILANKFQIATTTASDIVFYLPFGTILFTPLFGSLLDKKGKGASLMILGSVLLILAHFIFMYAPAEIAFAYLGIFILGIAFSLVPAAMWPSVPKVCPKNRLGTGYALIFWIQNLGLWAFPMLIGYIREKSNPGITKLIQDGRSDVYYDYTNPELMLVLVGVLALVFAFLLKFEDKKKNYGLEIPNIKSE